MGRGTRNTSPECVLDVTGRTDEFNKPMVISALNSSGCNHESIIVNACCRSNRNVENSYKILQVVVTDCSVAFYVDQHNIHLPHSAFQGQTPDEMYFGTGEHIPKELEAARLAARQSRLKANRALSCQKCEQLVSIGS